MNLLKQNRQATIQYLNETLQCLEVIDSASQWRDLIGPLQPSNIQELRRLRCVPAMIPVLMDTFNIVLPNLSSVR